MSSFIPLIEAVEEAQFGGKCVSLGAALRAGFPVPNGFAVDADLVERIAHNDVSTIAEIKKLFDQIGPTLAVRSSAIGEDSANASFAGQHLTSLNIMNADEMILAIKEIYTSAHTQEALAYREKMRVVGYPAIGVALQTLIVSETSGVMFTRNPINNELERYIEASWGFGEAVVAGLVIPDSFRIGNDGELIEKTVGEKDLELVSNPTGGIIEVEITDDKVASFCITDQQLNQLHQLASKCESVYGIGVDIEWTFSNEQLYLLQCRPITSS